jgi:kynureninase
MQFFAEHLTEAGAQALDREDPLGEFRGSFHLPLAPDSETAIYLCGNSLGPLVKQSRADVLRMLDEWEQLGVRGHFDGNNPWMGYPDRIHRLLAEIVGAKTEEVAVMGTLTNNIHLMLSAFYRPQGEKNKILAIAGGFPSDRYALHSMAALRGESPEDLLITVGPRAGEYLVRTADIEATLAQRGREIALVYLPGMHFATGQLLDMAAITQAAHAQGCPAGFDLAHAAGNVPLQLHGWDVDFAVWCGYKYLSAGPGHGAAIFVNERHARDPELPHLAGWWGNLAATRFEMRERFEPILSAARFQLSTPQTLALTPIIAALELFHKAGLEKIWAKSRQLTGYLEFLLDALPEQPFEIITPREPVWRGNQLTILLEKDAKAVAEALLEKRVIIDERPPNLIRVAPTPLYNQYHEVWQFVEIFKLVVSGKNK